MRLRVDFVHVFTCPRDCHERRESGRGSIESGALWWRGDGRERPAEGSKLRRRARAGCHVLGDRGAHYAYFSLVQAPVQNIIRPEQRKLLGAVTAPSAVTDAIGRARLLERH